MELILAESFEAGVDERDVVRRASKGDSKAFAWLVERYMRRAYYFALGLVGSPEDARDLSQEAFARAFSARRRLDPERPFYGWLFQILRRLCFNFNRDRRLRRSKLEGAKGWIAADAAARADDRNPERAVERAELIERVREAIERLPDREREVLALREFEGLRYREIAELLGVPIGTVMSRLYSARQNLAGAMEDDR